MIAFNQFIAEAKSRKASAALTKHKMWSEEDYNYLAGKGYSDKEIKDLWDRDTKLGKGPTSHDKAFDIVGYLNKDKK